MAKSVTYGHWAMIICYHISETSNEEPLLSSLHLFPPLPSHELSGQLELDPRRGRRAVSDAKLAAGQQPTSVLRVR